MEYKAIITGDVIASTAIPTLYKQFFISDIEQISKEIEAKYPHNMEFYRGDSFQIVVMNPVHSIRVAILLRAGMRMNTPKESKQNWDARLAIGVGTIDFTTQQLATSSGEAFINSGHLFDELGKRNLAVLTPWKDVNDELAVSTAFVDDIISNWTLNQARVAFIALLNPTMKQREIAELTKSTFQNVSKLLNAAKEPLVAAYLSRFENLIDQNR